MQSRTDKEQAVAELHDKFVKAKVAIVAEPKNLDVATVTELRKKFRAEKVEYKVVKNTLAIRAAKGTGAESLADLLAGPTAIIMGFEDPVTPAKVLQSFMNDKKDKIVVRGAVVDGQKIDAKGVEALSKMPGLQELRAIIAGMLTQPAQQIATLLTQPGAGIARVLQAKSEQK